MKYIKKYEKLISEYNVGDYIILHSDHYGKIIKIFKRMGGTCYDIEVYIEKADEPIIMNCLLWENIKTKISEEDFKNFLINRKAKKYNL